MKIRGPPHRAYFPITKKSADRDLAQFLLKEPRVVTAVTVEIFAPPQARKKESAGQLLSSGARGIHVERLLQIVGGSLGVAQVELHRLAFTQKRADSQKSLFGVQAHNIADEKIPMREMGFERVHHQAKEEGMLQKILIPGIQRHKKIPQNVERALAFEFHQDIPVALGHAHGLSNRPAALGDENVQRHISGERHANRAGSVADRIQV